MIYGSVNANLEPRIPLFVEDALGQPQPIEAVVDTGFSGFLTLPPALIASLGLTWFSQQQRMLGDGSIQFFQVYSAGIIWDTQARAIYVSAADTTPLVGTKLLEGSELRMRIVPGGPVDVDVVP